MKLIIILFAIIGAIVFVIGLAALVAFAFIVCKDIPEQIKQSLDGTPDNIKDTDNITY